jgi:hypothetical protein
LLKYEIVTTETVKINAFWHVMTCSLIETQRRFGETCCLQLHSSILKKDAAYSSGSIGKSLPDTQIIIIIIIITIAQQPYMGSGLLLPPLSEVTKSCAFVAVGDWPTGRATILAILMCPPEPSGRQSGDLGEKWRL